MHPKIKRERGRGEGVKKQHIWGGGKKFALATPLKSGKPKIFWCPEKALNEALFTTLNIKRLGHSYEIV